MDIAKYIKNLERCVYFGYLHSHSKTVRNAILEEIYRLEWELVGRNT